jgi:molecular chaperone DnaK (HSP70)
MPDMKTDPSLLKALEEAAKGNLTAAEVARQRVSFVMGSLKADNTITRAQVEEILAQQRGR